MDRLLLLLSSLTTLVSTGNILMCVNVPGSHLYVIHNAAKILAGDGHNVTILALGKDRRVTLETNERLRFIHPTEMMLYSDETLDGWTDYLVDSVEGDSADMFLNMVMYNRNISEYAIAQMKLQIEAYQTPYFETLITGGGFDLIIVEGNAVLPYAMKRGTLTDFKIPTVVISPIPVGIDVRSFENYPMLLNSEPNFYNDLIAKSPSFMDRFYSILRVIRLSTFFGEIGKLSSVGLLQSLSLFEMTFLLDHPALSFPSLIPPNTKYLGFFSLLEYTPKPLPTTLSAFLEQCQDRDVIMLSFGSFLIHSDKLLFLPTILKALIKTDLCVVLKSKKDIITNFSLPKNRFYVRDWIPQKDLLVSGKITFFFSHCGNNGRLEAAYYGVPLLCVPLFADQLFNSGHVIRRHLGLRLLKEEIIREGESSVLEKVNQMLENNTAFRNNIAVAKETVVNDPGSGINLFLHHINYIIKHGNARYLKNDIIRNQSTNEIYNLDILLLVLLGIISIVLLLLIAIVKLCCCVRGKLRKTKVE